VAEAGFLFGESDQQRSPSFDGELPVAEGDVPGCDRRQAGREELQRACLAVVAGLSARAVRGRYALGRFMSLQSRLEPPWGVKQGPAECIGHREG